MFNIEKKNDVWQFPECISYFNGNVALLSVLLFIFIFLFCYFSIPLFYHTRFNCFKWVFVCYHLAFFWSWVTQLLSLDKFLYFISFLFPTFIRCCFVQSQFIDIFYSVFCADWFWIVQCHFIVLTIILMTYPW